MHLIVPVPPLILFCDEIVGRITPPRVIGASGSESLCKIKDEQFKNVYQNLDLNAPVTYRLI